MFNAPPPRCHASWHSPAPRCVLGGGLIDRHAGGGEERRGVLTVTESTSRVQHARLAQSESQTATSAIVSLSSLNQGFFFFAEYWWLILDRVELVLRQSHDGTATESSSPPPPIKTLTETCLITQIKLMYGPLPTYRNWFIKIILHHYAFVLSYPSVLSLFIKSASHHAPQSVMWLATSHVRQSEALTWRQIQFCCCGARLEVHEMGALFQKVYFCSVQTPWVQGTLL